MLSLVTHLLLLLLAASGDLLACSMLGMLVSLLVCLLLFLLIAGDLMQASSISGSSMAPSSFASETAISKLGLPIGSLAKMAVY
jgi:hypothetical protein